MSYSIYSILIFVNFLTHLIRTEPAFNFFLFRLRHYIQSNLSVRYFWLIKKKPIFCYNHNSSSNRLGCAGGASECVFMHTVTAVMLDCCSSSNQEMLSFTDCALTISLGSEFHRFVFQV